MAKRPNYLRRASDADYIDLGRQMDAYIALTGDRPDYFGFDKRLAEWAEKHPRNSLTPTTRGEQQIH